MSTVHRSTLRSSLPFARLLRSRRPRAAFAALAAALVIVCIMGIVCAAIGLPGRAARAEGYPTEFLRALRQFFSEEPRARAEGEAALRRLGNAAFAPLERWIRDGEERLERLRQLLRSLDGAPPPREADEDRAVRAFFRDKLDEGWRLLLAGDHERAAAVAAGLEALDRGPTGGESPFLLDYRRLARACHRKRLTTEVLAPSVDFVERVYELSQTPQVLFRLINLTDEQLVLATDRGVLGTLEVTVDLSSMSGVTRSDVTTIPVRALDDAVRVVLPARRGYELGIPIPLGEADVGQDLVARVRVVGRFRPSQWGVKERNVNETLLVPETECWVVSSGQRDLAEAPLRKLEVAILFKDFKAFFVAGQLAVWAASEEYDLVGRVAGLLVRSLDDLDTYGFDVADRFLKQLAGLPPRQETDKAFWRDWQAARDAAPRTPPAASIAPGPPGTGSALPPPPSRRRSRP